MKNNYLFILVTCVTVISCHTPKHAGGTLDGPKPLDKEWTLEVSPNGADNVGVIFSIDSAGVVTRIPAGNLGLTTLTTPIAITQQKKTKSVSVGAIASFLAIKNIDSTANVTFQDTSHVQATFVVTSSKLTVIGNDTISAKFKAKAGVIADNIKFLGLEHCKFYLILETIKSSNVSITFDKTKQAGVSLAAKFKSIIGLSGHFRPSNTDSTDLVYQGNDSLTVFYKLRNIDVNVIDSKGPEGKRIDVSLGKVEKNPDFLLMKK